MDGLDVLRFGGGCALMVFACCMLAFTICGIVMWVRDEFKE